MIQAIIQPLLTDVTLAAKLNMVGSVLVLIDTIHFVFQNVVIKSRFTMKLAMMGTLKVSMDVHPIAKLRMDGIVQMLPVQRNAEID